MRPDRSASGTSNVGLTNPLEGWSQRRRASTPAILPVSVSTIGWYSVRSSPRADTPRRSRQAGPLVGKVLLAQVDDLVPGTPLTFRLVHRRIRVLEKLLGELSALTRERNTDTGRHHYFGARQDERCGYRGTDARRDHVGLCRPVEILAPAAAGSGRSTVSRVRKKSTKANVTAASQQRD